MRLMLPHRGRGEAPAGGRRARRHDGRAGATSAPARRESGSRCSAALAPERRQPWQTALAPGPSPLMNSSVMRRHWSSGCCTGGDFMK